VRLQLALLASDPRARIGTSRHQSNMETSHLPTPHSGWWCFVWLHFLGLDTTSRRRCLEIGRGTPRPLPTLSMGPSVRKTQYWTASQSATRTSHPPRLLVMVFQNWTRLAQPAMYPKVWRGPDQFVAPVSQFAMLVHQLISSFDLQPPGLGNSTLVPGPLQ
jgi:hypothetical protein